MTLERDAGNFARIVAHDTLGSTNAEAMALARAGEAGPLWITAARQTAGRGRRGNAWTSEPGNLHASLLLADIGPAAHLPELCFVAALAVRDAVAAVALTLAGRITLKWPNDLLLDGAKFCGILIEAETVRRRSVSVIGIGVNCAHFPGDTPYPATSLAAQGIAVEPAALLRALDRAMGTRLTQWNAGSGFAGVRADWLANAANLGAEIHVRLTERELTGTFETLDRMGRLMLRQSDGTLEAVTAGEVFARPPAGKVA